MYPCPIRLDKPNPNKVSARPVATWFDKSTCVKNPKSSAKMADATAAATNPSAGDPTSTAVINPAIAPIPTRKPLVL